MKVFKNIIWGERGEGEREREKEKSEREGRERERGYVADFLKREESGKDRCADAAVQKQQTEGKPNLLPLGH